MNKLKEKLVNINKDLCYMLVVYINVLEVN